MTANLLWLTEFLLEALGAWLCFNKFAGERVNGIVNSMKFPGKGMPKTSPAIQVSCSGTVEGHGNSQTCSTSGYGARLRNSTPPDRVQGFGTAESRSEYQASPATGIQPLGIYLAFRALADVVTFSVLISAGQTSYYWADFWLRTVAYILFWILAMFTVAKVLREDKHTAVFYLGMTLIFGAFAVVCFHAQPLTMHRVWRFEIWADIVAGALVCMAMGTQEWAGRTVPKLWAMVSLGIFVQSASDGILAAGQYHGKDVAAWYPIGAILALGIWAWGLRKAESIDEVRLPLQSNLEALELAELEEAQ